MLAGEADPGGAEGQENSSDDTYVVQRGDTLAGVALRLGVKQSELKRANHMYGSRTLVAGQVLKTAAPAKPTKEQAMTPAIAPPGPVSRAESETGAREGGGAKCAVTPTGAMTAADTPSQAVAKAQGDGDGGVLLEPPEEEIWFEDRQQPEDRSAGVGTKTGSSPAAAATLSTSSLLPPFEETKWSSTASATTPELLYEPLNWGGGGAAGGSRSRQGSDASSSASAAAAAAGASVRGMFQYIRAKAAAVTTPTAAAAAAAAGFAFDSVGGDGSGGGGLSSTTRNGPVEEDRLRQPSAAGTVESSLTCGGSTGDGGDSSDIVESRGCLGSPLPMPGEPGEPTVDESLPPVELWGGERKDGIGAQAVACAVAQDAAREVSVAAQRDTFGVSSAEALQSVGSKSKTETLLSMVKPSYWRGSEGGGSEGATLGSEPPFGYGGGGGGGPSTGWVIGDNDRGVRVPSFGSPRKDDGILAAESIRRSSDPSEEAADVAGFALNEPGVDSAPPPPPPEAVPFKLPGLVCGGSMIVTHLALARMEAALPKHHRGYNWHLLFSTLRDGASYTTLYNRIKAEEPTFMIVESMKGEVFGGFATSAWASGSQYYGTGECFLFKLENGERVAVDTGGDADSDGGSDASPGGSVKNLMEGDIATFEWTGMNMYLQYSDGVGMGMGGGGITGSFGLFVGEDFLSGSTGKCDTYGNPPLCSQEQFQVSQVEIWGFTTADTEMGARLERLRKTLRGKTTRPL